MNTKPKWKPTHEVVCEPGGTWTVMIYEGKYHTEGLWQERGEPNWVVGPKGDPRYVGNGWDPHNGKTRITVTEIQPRPSYVPNEADLEDPKLIRIREVAEKFRGALEKARCDSTVPNMAGFPLDCCHHASRLLNLYIHEHTDMEIFDEVCGEYHTKEHCWLERGDVIVDITADQFDEGLPAVVVTRHSDWHAAWNRQENRPSHQCDKSLEELKQLYQPLYSRLLAKLKPRT